MLFVEQNKSYSISWSIILDLERLRTMVCLSSRNVSSVSWFHVNPSFFSRAIKRSCYTSKFLNKPFVVLCQSLLEKPVRVFKFLGLGHSSISLSLVGSTLTPRLKWGVPSMQPSCYQSDTWKAWPMVHAFLGSQRWSLHAIGALPYTCCTSIYKKKKINFLKKWFKNSFHEALEDARCISQAKMYE